VKQGELLAGQALQPAHEPTRHNGTLPRSSGVAVAGRVFPVLSELGYLKCWRETIVVGRGRKSSARFGWWAWCFIHWRQSATLFGEPRKTHQQNFEDD
jgi:hypothetical protein